MCFYAPSRPRINGQIAFLGTHIPSHKKDNGNPAINYFNLIVIKIHALPRQNL